MIIYFNDTFLEEELFRYSADNFENSIKSFITYSDVIATKRMEYSVKIYFKTNESIKDIFDLFEGEKEDYGTLFLRQLSKLNVKYWNGRGVQVEANNYYYLDTAVEPPLLVDVKNKTLAEAAETRARGKESVFALNLPNLKFNRAKKINVTITRRDAPDEISNEKIECGEDEADIVYWIDSLCSKEFEYSDFNRTPIDQETCLRNGRLFNKVNGRKESGKQVYADDNNQYWYIDNLHKGDAAHLEVFNRIGEHIGEASLFGEINYSKKGNAKDIDI